MLVVAKTEEEISQLEVYVYDESSENLYVHHDLMLPNFPLCLEWLDFGPAPAGALPGAERAPGNFVAVGTLDPEIEIWSLDVVDPMYPDMLLGRPDLSHAHVPAPLGAGKKKRKKAKHRAATPGWHVDAVLALAWNRTHRNLLASASADRTVKLWDLTRAGAPPRAGAGDEDEPMDGAPAGVLGADGAGAAIRSFDKLHKDKVQAVQWNPREPTVLLTGSYDRTVRTIDTRAPDGGVGAVVGADVEALCWDPWEAHAFYASRPVCYRGLAANGAARRCRSRTAWSSVSTPAHCRHRRRSRPRRARPASRCRRTTARSPRSTSTRTSGAAWSPAARTSRSRFGTSTATATA
jgi:periodic tryptophan protein 1